MLFGQTRVHNPNGISIGSAFFAQLAVDSPYMLQWAPLLRPKLPFLAGDLVPSYTWFRGFSQLSIANDISFALAVSAQLTAESPYTLEWAPLSPKIAHSRGGLEPYLTHGSFGPPESSTQMACRSIQPFCRTRCCDRQRIGLYNKRAHLRIGES